MMRGKTCLITGASSGIGEQSAYALSEMGARVLLVCRNEEKGNLVAQRIRERTGEDLADVIVGDLASLTQVRRIAQVVIDRGRPLDVLLNNAGVFNMKRKLTVDGHEEMFAVNHLAHFLLTNLLLDLIKSTQGARVVTVGSGAHKLTRSINFDDLRFDEEFKALKVYSHSKLANVLFGHTLAARLSGTGVTSNVVDPGEVGTNLGGQNGILGTAVKNLMSVFLQSPTKGATTSVYACASPELEGVTAQYLRHGRRTRARPWATDLAAGERLWAVSKQLVQSVPDSPMLHAR